jgi:hypothetical protein
MRLIRLSRRSVPSQTAGLTRRSDLRGIVLRMISLNSLAAFTAEVSRLQAPAQARAASSTPATTAPEAPRRLDALPPQPSSPLPRGSLLDLRV